MLYSVTLRPCCEYGTKVPIYLVKNRKIVENTVIFGVLCPFFGVLYILLLFVGKPCIGAALRCNEGRTNNSK